MLVESAAAALRQTFSPPLRAILWKSLGLTVGLLALVWFGLTKGIAALLAAHPISTDYAMVNAVASFLAGAGLFVGLAYILPPVSILVAGYFLDDAAEIVERTDFPDEVPGRAMPLGQAILLGTFPKHLQPVALVVFALPPLLLALGRWRGARSPAATRPASSCSTSPTLNIAIRSVDSRMCLTSGSQDGRSATH